MDELEQTNDSRTAEEHVLRISAEAHDKSGHGFTRIKASARQNRDYR